MKKLILLLSLICVVAVAYAQDPPTCCPNCPLFLPDGDSAEFPIGVADNGDGDGDSNDDCTTMVLESIAIMFDHEYIGDLIITATSPCGNTITLIGPGDVIPMGDTDGSTWDIVFVDGTAMPDPGFNAVFDNTQMWGLNGMFTGTYNPFMGTIADLNCPDNCGTWNFFVTDIFGQDDGNFLDFNLNFGQPTMDGEIACTSEPCAIDAVEITNVQCNDNNTPTMPGDDTYTFDLTATATQGTTFSDNQSGTGLAYDTPISYGPFPISGGDVIIDIVDDGDVACIGSATATAPPTCSPLMCSITPEMASNIVCDDNGTVTMSDDTYTFDILVDGDNPEPTASQTFSDDQGNAGIAYGTTLSYGPFPISGGNVIVNYTDAENATCTATMMGVAPEPCSEPGTAEANITAVCSCFGDQNIDTNNSGEADIFFEEITITTTLAQPGITDWAFGPGTTGVFYDMTGAIITTPDSVVDNGDGTYTIGVYVASGQFYSADFVSAAANDGLGIATGVVSGGGCEFCDDIPTVGEWGLIILCLSMFITAIVGIRQRQNILVEERA